MLLGRSKLVCTYLLTQISTWGLALFTPKNFGRPTTQYTVGSPHFLECYFPKLLKTFRTSSLFSPSERWKFNLSVYGFFFHHGMNAAWEMRLQKIWAALLHRSSLTFRVEKNTFASRHQYLLTYKMSKGHVKDILLIGYWGCKEDLSIYISYHSPGPLVITISKAVLG